MLDFLVRPDTPSAFVDQLLAYEEGDEKDRSGQLLIVRSGVAPYIAAAWGAFALDDAARCRLAVEMALQVFADDPNFHVAVDVREEMSRLESLWKERHGSSL